MTKSVLADKEVFQVFICFIAVCLVGHIAFFSTMLLIGIQISRAIKFFYIMHVVGSLFILINLHYLVSILLMHDIELNPGPVVRNSLFKQGFKTPSNKIKFDARCLGPPRVLQSTLRKVREYYAAKKSKVHCNRKLDFETGEKQTSRGITDPLGSEDFEELIKLSKQREITPEIKAKLVVYAVRMIRDSQRIVPQMQTEVDGVPIGVEGTEPSGSGSWFSLKSFFPTVKVKIDPETLATAQSITENLNLHVDTDIGQELRKVANKISADDVQRISHLAGSTADIMDIVTNVLGKVKNFDINSWVKDKRLLIAAIVALFALIYRTTQVLGQGQSIFDNKLVLCLMGLLIYYIVVHASEFNFIMPYILSFFSIKPQMIVADGFLENGIKPIVSALTDVPLVNTFDSLWHKVERHHKRYKTIENVVKSFQDLFQSAIKYIFPVLEMIADALRLPITQFFSNHQIRVQKLYDQTLKVLDEFNTNDKVLSSSVISSFNILNSSLDAELKSLSPSAENSFLRSTLLGLKAQLLPIGKSLKSRGGSMTKPMPFMLYLYGASNCGKTTFLSNVLMPLLIKEFIPEDLLSEYEANPSCFSFEKDSSKWWDGYTPNVVGVFYTDLFCAKDRAGAEASDAQTIISIGGTNKFKLPIASLEGKADTYFSSPVVLAASNVRHITNEIVGSINNSDALCNRMNRFAFKMHLRREWATPEGKLDYAKYSMFRATNRSLCPDFAIFEKIDVRPAHLVNDANRLVNVGAMYGTHDFIRLCIAEVRKMKNSQDGSVGVNNDFFERFIVGSDDFFDPDKYAPHGLNPADCTGVIQEEVAYNRLRLDPQMGGKTTSMGLMRKFKKFVPSISSDSQDILYMLHEAFENKSAEEIVKRAFRNMASEFIYDNLSRETVNPESYFEKTECHVIANLLADMIFKSNNFNKELLELFTSYEQYDDALVFCDKDVILYLILEYENFSNTPRWWDSSKAQWNVTYYKVRQSITNAYESYMEFFSRLLTDGSLWRGFFKHTWLFLTNFSLKNVLAGASGLMMVLGIVDTLFPQYFTADPQMGKQQDDREKASSCVLNNGVIIRVVETKDGKDTIGHAVYAVFVKNRYLLVVNHFVEYLEELVKHGCSTISVDLCFIKENNTLTEGRPVNKIKFGKMCRRVAAPWLIERDLAILQFEPEVVTQCPGIINYLPSNKWTAFLSGLKTGYKSLYYRKNRVLESYLGTIKYGFEMCDSGTPAVQCAYCESFQPLPTTLDYPCLTLNTSSVEGDCGILGFCIDEARVKYQSVWPTIANPIILYFHVAGGRGLGFGVPIFKEDFSFLKDSVVKCRELREVKSEFEDRIKVELQASNVTLAVPAEEVVTPFAYNYDASDEFPPQHRIIGVIAGKPPAARSRIEKTEMHDKIPPEYRANRKPGRLCPSKDKEGVAFYPLLEGIKPYGTAHYYFDVDSVADFISEYVPLKFRHIVEVVPKNDHFVDSLTYQQVVEGIPGRINGINRKSSPGPYFDFIKKALMPHLSDTAKLNGMGWIWGDEGPYDMTTTAARLVENLFKYFDGKIREGYEIYNVFNASLKDECVSVEKQASKGIRVFFSGSVINLMLFKKYFGHYMAYAQETREVRSAQVGINCHKEFSRLYSDLSRFNEGVLCFDFSKFDKRMHFIYLNAFFKEAELYYIGDRDPQGHIARQVLKEMVHRVYVQVCLEKPNSVFQFHYADVPGADAAYDIQRKNITPCFILEMANITPSGMYPTAAANSEACEVIHMKSIYDLYIKRSRILEKDILPLEDFVRKICLFTYGDDSIMAFSKSLDDVLLVEGTFDVESYLDCVFDNGYLATDENVSTDKVKGMPRVIDGTFLARKFHENEDHIILAKLRDESIYNAPAYCDKFASTEQKIDAVNSAITELAGGGRDRFHENIVVDLDTYYYEGPRYKHLIDACYKAYGQYPRVLDYKTALACLGSGKYTMGYSYSELTPQMGVDSGCRNTKQRMTNSVVVPSLTENYQLSAGDSVIKKSRVRNVAFTNEHDQLFGNNVYPKGQCMVCKVVKETDETLDWGNHGCRHKESPPDSRERIYVRLQSSSEVTIKTVHTLDSEKSEVKCDDAGTTCFVEDDSVKKNPHDALVPFNDYIVRDDTLSAFFAKPQLISVTDWTTGMAAGSNIFNFSISSRLLEAPIADKLKGFSLFRAKFVVRIEINSNPFQAGLLYLHYIPNQKDRVATDPGFLTRVNSNLPAKLQHPGAYIYASDKSVEFEIPYVAPSLYYDVRSDRYDWGHVHLDVILPLTTGAAGQLVSELSVFGYFVDCEFVGPIVPQSGRTKITKNVESREAKGTISKGLLSVGKAADALSEIPVISSYASAAAFVSRSLAGLVSYFGFSKPRLLEQNLLVAQQPGRYTGNSTGGDTSHPLGNLSDNGVDILNTHSITGMDEMSFAFLKKVPHYYAVVPWTTTQVSDTTLIYDVISTSLTRSSITVNNGTSNMTYVQNGPIWLLSNFFRHWRGSVRMHIKIAKTKFHSGKLMIAFNPGDKPTQPTNTNSVFLLRNIIDLSLQDEFEIEFPYVVWQTWLETGNNVAAGNRCSGAFRLSVLNSLRAPETCAQSVNMLVYFTFGDDYQFNTPCGSYDGLVPAASIVPIPVSLQASSETVYKDVVSRSSHMDLKMEPNSKASGDMYTSIKQLLTRMTPLPLATDALVDTSGDVLINPWELGLGRHVGPNIAAGAAVYDAMSVFLTMYMFHRGSVRVLLKQSTADSGSNYATASLVSGRSNIPPSRFLNTAPDGNNPIPGRSSRISAPSYHYSPTCAVELLGNNEPVYVRVPPGSQMPAFILPIDDARTAGAVDISSPRSYIAISTKAGSFAADSGITFSRGVGDDWVSTFFLCAPPMFVRIN